MKLVLLAYLQLVLMSSSCKKESSYYDYRLKIVNKSDKIIYADFYQSYPDTTLSIYSHFDDTSAKAFPNETISLIRGGSWESAFNSEIKQKLEIFIYDAKTIENLPWETIKKNYLVLKRYDLSLGDLQKMDWTITYP